MNWNLTNTNIFDNLPDKRVAWLCLNWVTNVCELRNKMTTKGTEKICHECQKNLLETINDPILGNMTLSKFFTLPTEHRWEFIIKNEIRKNRIVWKYIPDKTNKFAKARSMNGLELKDLTAGEIYFTFKKYIDFLKQQYIKNTWLIAAQVNENSRLSLIEWEKQISEYFEYNTKNRDNSEKWLNFKIITERPKNTTFQNSFNYWKISDICLINQEWISIPINKIPWFTIKNKNYNKLSEQINHYISNPKKFEKELNIPFVENEQKLIKYMHIVEQIEWACESNENQAQNYVKPAFEWWQTIREWKMKKIVKQNDDTTDPWRFEIAPQKRISRAVEKIIISHDWDISKATDNCRWTIRFNTIWDLQKWMLVFVDCLKEYNKWQKDETKQVKELYFEDKFWNLVDFSKKASGYRDGKFLIKMWDGNVIELMLQLEDMYIAKNEWFEYMYEKPMTDVIKKIKLNIQDIKKINEIIDNIDPSMSKRWKMFFNKKTKQYKIPHIQDFKNGDRIPADLIYNIYRNLEEYDRTLDKQWKKTLPFEKPIEEWSSVEKLQLLERETYQRWYKQHACKIQQRMIKNEYEKHNSGLKNNGKKQ